MKEKLMMKLKAAVKAAVIAFLGALGFGALMPEQIAAILKLLGLM